MTQPLGPLQADGYSAKVELSLEVGGVRLSVGRIGSDTCILRNEGDSALLATGMLATAVIVIDGNRKDYAVRIEEVDGRLVTFEDLRNED